MRRRLLIPLLNAVAIKEAIFIIKLQTQYFKFSAEDFTMWIALIGMSKIGKTTWSKRLATQGFATINCDDLIGQRLTRLMGQPLETIPQTADWMGMANHPTYLERERIFLECETAVMQQVLQTLSTISSSPVEVDASDTTTTAVVINANNARQNLVIDTGGSVIYLGDSFFEQLRQYCQIVHLQPAADFIQQRTSNNPADYKGLIWGGLMQQRPDEDYLSALIRCYHDLITHRQTLYEKYCTISVPYEYHRDKTRTVNELLEFIKERIINLAISS
jgi:shikimate kinase